MNAQNLLIDSANGVYSWNRLVNNYDVYVQVEKRKVLLKEWLINNSDVMDNLYTLEAVFNPNTETWCENLEYLEHLGLFVQDDNFKYWHIEQTEHGDIWGINPLAEWDYETEEWLVPVAA